MVDKSADLENDVMMVQFVLLFLSQQRHNGPGNAIMSLF